MYVEPAEAELDDERVVELVRGGDRARFEILMRRHNQRVYRAVRFFLRDDAEIEDVMQQAYLRAFLRLDSLVAGSKVKSWLVKIAVNEALDRLRQRRRLNEYALDETEEGEPTAASTPEEQLGDRELAALLGAALGDLREIYRAVFVLREIEGLSTEEVAEALGVTENVVKIRLHRAKDRLRQRLLQRAGRAASDVFAFAAPRCDRVVAATLARIAHLADS
jgi:RNA polymerase sigma-70 factor (ECF subfamily)